jgi:hypothetical protein
MNAEDAGSHVSYYGRLIKHPLLCTENLESLRKVVGGIYLE